MEWYLPIFRVALEHQWVFRLADFADIVLLDFLDIFLSLDPIVFGEGTLMTLLFNCQILEPRMRGWVNGS